MGVRDAGIKVSNGGKGKTNTMEQHYIKKFKNKIKKTATSPPHVIFYRKACIRAGFCGECQFLFTSVTNQDKVYYTSHFVGLNMFNLYV